MDLSYLADAPVLAEITPEALGPWSPSRMKCLEKCPLQFYLKYIAKVSIPDEEMGDVDTLNRDVGTAANLVIELMIQKNLTANDAFDMVKHIYRTRFNEEEMEYFEGLRQTIREFKYWLFQLEESRPEGRIKDAIAELELAVDKNFLPVPYDSPKAFLRGSIDLKLDFFDGGRILLDHKHGGNPAFGIKYHMPQLNIYTLLAHFGHETCKYSSSGINFLRQAGRTISPTAHRDEIEKVLTVWFHNRMKKMFDAIYDAGEMFYKRSSMCQYCEFQAMCTNGKRGTSGELHNLQIATRVLFS